VKEVPPLNDRPLVAALKALAGRLKPELLVNDKPLTTPLVLEDRVLNARPLLLKDGLLNARPLVLEDGLLNARPLRAPDKALCGKLEGGKNGPPARPELRRRVFTLL